MKMKTVTRRGYKDYIRSSDWRLKRTKYNRSRLEKICTVCGADDEPLDTHHKTYKRLGNERLTDLCRVCRHCHQRIHELAERKRIPLWQATTRLRRDFRKAWKRVDQNALRLRTVRPTIAELSDPRNFTRARLAAWGVSWPPKQGWLEKLRKLAR